jgi:GTP cyclohydrolase I
MLYPVFSGFYSPEDPKNTARRIAKMWVEEFWHQPPPEVATFFVANANQQFIFSGPIPFSSWCAHHALPFSGNIWVAYRPAEERVYGLSKIPRLAKWAFHGLSLQEDATEILMEELWLGMPLDMCMIRAEAHHTCVSCRGAQSPGGVVTRLERGASPEDLQRFNFEIGR